MKTRMLLLLLSGSLLWGGCPLIPNGGDPFRFYPYPQSIAIRLEPADTTNTARIPSEVVGLIRAENGTLRQLTVYREASDDLTVSDAAPVRLDELREGETRQFPFRVTKNGTLTSARGSWARIRVTYRPDYDRLLTLVSDSLRFPPREIRMTYIERTQQNRTANAFSTDAARLFFP